MLLKELFAYLQESPVLGEEFPFLKSDPHFEENWMALHLQMLKARLVPACPPRRRRSADPTPSTTSSWRS